MHAVETAAKWGGFHTGGVKELVPIAKWLSAYWEMVKRSSVMAEMPEAYDLLYPAAPAGSAAAPSGAFAPADGAETQAAAKDAPD